MEFIPIHSLFAQSLYQWLLPTLCNVLVSMDPIKRSVVAPPDFDPLCHRIEAGSIYCEMREHEVQYMLYPEPNHFDHFDF